MQQLLASGQLEFKKMYIKTEEGVQGCVQEIDSSPVYLTDSIHEDVSIKQDPDEIDIKDEPLDESVCNYTSNLDEIDCNTACSDTQQFLAYGQLECKKMYLKTEEEVQDSAQEIDSSPVYLTDSIHEDVPVKQDPDEIDIKDEPLDESVCNYTSNLDEIDCSTACSDTQQILAYGQLECKKMYLKTEAEVQGSVQEIDSSPVNLTDQIKEDVSIKQDPDEIDIKDEPLHEPVCNYTSNLNEVEQKEDDFEEVQSKSEKKACEVESVPKAQSVSPRIRKRVDYSGKKSYNKSQLCKKSARSSGVVQKTCKSPDIQVHTREKRYKCNLCNYKAIKKAHLDNHIRTHTGEKPFQCSECSRKFSRKHHLTKHVQIHKGEQTYQCNLCNYEASQKSHLTKHMRFHTDQSKNGKKVCEVESVSEAQSLSQHINETVDYSGEESYNKSARSSAVVQETCKSPDIQVHTREKCYKCKSCDYEATQKSHLVAHIRTHTGEKPFQCSECSRKFARKCQLTKHVRIHTGERLYACNSCDYKATQKSNLVVHMRTHTGDKPYECSECLCKFGSKHHLTRHIRTHTGEKPYKCKLCNYEAPQKSALDNHIRIHAGERPFQCSECSWKFTMNSYLKRHMKLHRKP